MTDLYTEQLEMGMIVDKNGYPFQDDWEKRQKEEMPTIKTKQNKRINAEKYGIFGNPLVREHLPELVERFNEFDPLRFIQSRENKPSGMND